LLLVQAAIPRGPAEDVEHLLRTLLFDAIDEAERWARRRELAVDLDLQRRIADVATAGPLLEG
jgi:hypothetical protein